MGKRLRQQRRGRGTVAYTKAPGTFDISVRYSHDRRADLMCEVVDIINHTGHTAPLIKVLYEDMSTGHLVAPEGVMVGDKLHIGPTPRFGMGNVLKIGSVPEGLPVYNVETMPGDGGKMVRAAGSAAYVLAHIGGNTTLALPSKASVTLDSECRAQLGVCAGGGMNEQPIVKAGKNHYIKHAINTMWPTYRGVKLNPVDHPFGGKQHHKGKSSMTSRNAPPGRKVGHIAASRVGRRKKG